MWKTKTNKKYKKYRATLICIYIYIAVYIYGILYMYVLVQFNKNINKCVFFVRLFPPGLVFFSVSIIISIRPTPPHFSATANLWTVCLEEEILRVNPKSKHSQPLTYCSEDANYNNAHSYEAVQEGQQQHHHFSYAHTFATLASPERADTKSTGYVCVSLKPQKRIHMACKSAYGRKCTYITTE